MEWLKLSVIFLIVCVIQCWGVSNDELEDFMNFLKKTSQLDQTIRKGVDPDDDFDEDERVSDHAWEESGKFEGDLILNDRQRRLIVQDVAEGLSRNGLKDSTKRWPNNEVIYYIQKEHFSSDQVQAIQSGIDDLAQASCIRFRPYKKGDRDAVVIQGSRRGCFSQVGYQSGYQVLNLSGRHPVGRGCFRHGTVVHELLHTLGFYHMQSSPDRDDYIDVAWENIIKQARHNFRKYNSFAVSDFGVGYDYDSVLHYSRRAFSSNGQDTLIPKKGGAEIGQRLGLSDKDTQKLNKMYCDADSNNNEADDDPSSNPANKKKKPKNKPFDGHGIGYHQGKTVVIKLLPAPETYKLPDVPTFHVFDYFSKAPQALSTSEIEGYRPGKEITYPQFQPAIKTVQTSETETSNVNTEDRHNDKLSNDDKIEASNLEVNDTPKNIKTFIAEKPNISSKEVFVDLSDNFDSLAKIIKSHVYPSQIPDFRIYKLNNNYDKLYDSQKYLEDRDTYAPKETDDDVSKSSVEVIRNLYDLPAARVSQYNRGDKTTETHFQEEKHNPITEKHGDTQLTDSGQRKQNSFEVDSSYRTSSFPKANQYREHSDSAIRSYAVPKIQYKNDYITLHNPKIEDHSKLIGKNYFDEEWYRKDIHTHNPAVYGIDSYSDSLNNVKSKSYLPDNLPTENPYHSNDRGDVFNSMPPETNQKYSLFGLKVPLNEEWYKIDYSKANHQNTDKDSASNEDNR